MLQEKALSSSLIGPEEFPGLYCASGRENCTDLDEHEECLCMDCLIWKENDLESGDPSSYFCIKGPSIHCNIGKTNNEDPERVAEMLRHYYRRTD
jgi:hypothetical protein